MTKIKIRTAEAEVIRLKSLLYDAQLQLKQAEIVRLKLVKKIKKLESRK